MTKFEFNGNVLLLAALSGEGFPLVPHKVTADKLC